MTRSARGTGVRVAAVDLGASSGRVVLAGVGEGRLDVQEVGRTPNIPVRLGGRLYWDMPRLYAGVVDGVREAGSRLGGLDSVGIDAWAVDYGLIDGFGELVGLPIHYRDERTEGVASRVHETVSPSELFAVNGLQHLAFTTLFQLAAEVGSPRLRAAESLLLVPDLVSFWLTGQVGAELTNASTTGLLDVRRQMWATDTAELLGLPAALLPQLRLPGEHAGDLRPDVMAGLGLPGRVPVTVVGSHDTASAVVAVPATSPRFAYVCTGTWSLAGLELPAPVLSEEARASNFTNEAGVDGTTRFLRNVMGMWLLQECLRTWSRARQDIDVEAILNQAAAQPGCRSIVDVDDPIFLTPGDMPARIATACRRTGQPVPEGFAATVRCLLDSIVLGHRRALHDAQRLADVAVDIVHVVGGGARNALLCQLTADATGLPVVAGPVEAAALGNALVQARALGATGPELSDLRSLVATTTPLVRYEPREGPHDWEEVARRSQTS